MVEEGLITLEDICVIHYSGARAPRNYELLDEYTERFYYDFTQPRRRADKPAA